MQAEEAPWEAESQDSQSSYNDSTQEPRSQEFRKIYGEEDGADWWKTAAQEEAKDASGVDQYDDAKTWSWTPYETLYRTDGSRMGLVREADGTRHIGEVPDTKVWIRLKDGTLLSDEPFDACIDYMGTPEGEVYCIRNGHRLPLYRQRRRRKLLPQRSGRAENFGGRPFRLSPARYPVGQP